MSHADSNDRSDRRRPWRLVADLLPAVLLLAALAAVWALDARRRDAASPAAEVEEDLVLPRRSLQLAVTPRELDDMGGLLDKLGAAYRYREIKFDDLLDPAALAAYDVVFLTCGGVPRHWLGEAIGPGERDFPAMALVRPEIKQELRAALREFVAAGGTLYVSDLHFRLLRLAFPEVIDEDRVAQGDQQTVDARVTDAGLRELVGPQVALRFDQPHWFAAAFLRDKAATLLEGRFQTTHGGTMDGPLLARFSHGRGTVIFTSFHNEKQNSDTELKLLRYLVFATVTAREDQSVQRTMIRGGFSPQHRSLLSVSQESRPYTQPYTCRKPGPLQFALGFDDRGAQLTLTVSDPQGIVRAEQTGTSTFRLDVPDAAPGQWTCTVTPLAVPSENFPFTLTVGEKR